MLRPDVADKPRRAAGQQVHDQKRDEGKREDQKRERITPAQGVKEKRQQALPLGLRLAGRGRVFDRGRGISCRGRGIHFVRRLSIGSRLLRGKRYTPTHHQEQSQHDAPQLHFDMHGINTTPPDPKMARRKSSGKRFQ